MSYRVGFESQTPIRRGSSTTLQKLQKLRDAKEPTPPSRVIARERKVHTHEQGSFGHYVAARGQHPAHRAVHRWCEPDDLGRFPAPSVQGFEDSYASLDSLFKRGIVGEVLVSRVRELLDRARLFAGATDIGLHGPWLAASDDGSIGLDWRHGVRRCAITFDSSGAVEFYAADGLTETSGSIESAGDAMKQILWLVRAEEISKR